MVKRLKAITSLISKKLKLKVTQTIIKALKMLEGVSKQAQLPDLIQVGLRKITLVRNDEIFRTLL
jgi:hypothetical protein